MTILEVLFAIMITTIGLLGAVAVFPVASEYARKGRLNDEVTVCAESAVHTMDARGMRRPDRWITWRYVNGGLQGNAYYVPGTAPLQVISNPPPVIVRAGINAGESYCLDPRFMAANVIPNANPALIPRFPEGTIFPAFPRRPAAQVTGPNDPDNFAMGNPGAPRMQRITLANGAAGSAAPYAPANFPPMGQFQADYVFSFMDQLTYERPGIQRRLTGNDNASPAFQLYTPINDPNSGTIYPGKREEDGRLSWIATLVPKLDRWNATLDDKYVLSVVVFYNRGLGAELSIEDFTQPLTKPVKEWTAVILGRNANDASDFHSGGYGGGEVTITANNPDKLRMRSGDWVMLSGHARYGGSTPTIGNFKWYRVSDADEDPYETAIGSGIWKRDVTLIGPDWDLQNVLPFDTSTGLPNPDFYGNGNPIYDDVEVTIVPHIVAVFDRTVRLELDGTGY